MKLRTRILLWLATLLTAVLTVSAVLEIVTTWRHDMENLRTRADVLCHVQRPALGWALWQYDQGAGHYVLNGALEDPAFVEAVVHDDTGRPFAALQSADASSTSSEQRVRTSCPISYEIGDVVRQLGRMELTLSTRWVEARLWVAIANAALQLGVLLLVVLLVIAVVLRSFTRPIESMTEVMRRRAAGDLSMDVDSAFVGRKDEIGAIARSLELDQQQRRDEAQLLEITRAVSQEGQVEAFLSRLSDAARTLVGAEHSSLYVLNPDSGKIWTLSQSGGTTTRIELAPDQGLAGACFTGGEAIRIDDVYDDPRFDQSWDKKTGYRTRSMLCVPIQAGSSERVGVLQVLNRVASGQGEPASAVFSERDELRLRSLATQAAVAIENARLFDDVVAMKNYNESMLRSMSAGVVSLDRGGRIATLNPAATATLGLTDAHIGQLLGALLGDANAWIMQLVQRVERSGHSETALDTDLQSLDGEQRSVNLTAVPLSDAKGGTIGSLLLIEDISAEKRMRSTMTRYIARELVDQLLHGDKDVLGGTAQTVTCLFADIRHFTTISEAIGPRETVTMLNEYFSEMWHAIDREGGIIDKYIGDAVFAVFGVPFPQEDDAERAVRAATGMIHALNALNTRRGARGQQALEIGIGLSTGEVVSGNIGSPKRMAYTVIGDPVNLASRLEGATKQYAAQVLVSQFTAEHMTDRSGLREVDILRVKGKVKPVSVYESLSHRFADGGAALQEALTAHKRGLTAFRGRRWVEARAAFEEVLRHQPGDAVADLYLRRIAAYEASPPPEGWDGIVEMRTK